MEVDVDVDADVREAQTASTAASGEMLAAHACTHLTSILGRPSLRIRGRREFEGPVPVPVPRAIQSSRNLKWAHLRLRGRGARWPASAVVLHLPTLRWSLENVDEGGGGESTRTWARHPSEARDACMTLI